jgi:hypothetical protein
MLPSIESEWQSFKDLVIDPEAPEYQIIDMKNAFYAGVKSLMMLESGLVKSNLSKEKKSKVFDSWNFEVDQYFVDLVKYYLKEHLEEQPKEQRSKLN